MFALNRREEDGAHLSALGNICEDVYMIGVEKMSCEEYVKEIKRMLDIALKRRDRSFLDFVYKLLRKYVEAHQHLL